MTRRLAAILAADIVGYSKLMEEDEIGTLSALKSHRSEIFDPLVAGRNGRIFKLTGDGAFVEFPSVVDAVECALEIQRAIAKTDGPIRIRIGVNLGDVIIEEEDIYGDGVNVAARVEALSEPGGVCLSEAAYNMIVGKIGCEFEDCGVQPLKNLQKKVRIYHARDARFGQGINVGSSSERQSIAVLPFSNMSGDQEQEYFSDGITEDIITDLSKLSGLLVIARNSTFSYKGLSVKIQKISTDLDAKYVVEGSVRKSGNRVRVTAQLIDGSSGGHLWADRYDRELTDVFEVQDEITRNIVDALKIAIDPTEEKAIARIPTQNLDAYDCCLRGRKLLHEMNKDNLDSACRLFEEAVRLDPEYTLALSGLADCDATVFHFYSSDLEFIESAIRHCAKALALDPALAEAHASMGSALFLKKEYKGAEHELSHALSLDPMLYEAHWNMGLTKLDQGDFEKAADAFSNASRVRGDDLQSNMMLMNCLFALSRKQELAAVALQTLSIADRRLQLNDSDARAAYIGAFALIHMEQMSKAKDWLRHAENFGSVDPRTTYNVGCAYSLVGDTDKALEYIKRSILAGRPKRMLDWALIDPDLEPIRRDEGFGDLIELWRNQEDVRFSAE